MTSRDNTHRLRNRAMALLLAVASFAAVCDRAMASCDNQPARRAPVERTWVKSDKAIYLAKDGKIYQGRFDSERLTLLADHGYDYIADFRLSADAQFIAYIGYKKGHFSSFLYDVKRAVDFPLPIVYEPPTVFPRIEFSPDSKSAAWADINPRTNSQHFVIIDLATKTANIQPFPLDVRTLRDYRDTDVKWAAGADHIYLATIAFPVGAYFKYDVAVNKTTQISGEFGDGGLHFVENGSDLPYYRSPCLQWQCSDQGRAMDGESAVIDKSQNLIVKTAAGEVTVDKGGVNQCEGVTIRMISWLENGKYLIYQLVGVTYIYGVEEKRKSVLFDSEGSLYFGWADTGKRRGFPF